MQHFITLLPLSRQNTFQEIHRQIFSIDKHETNETSAHNLIFTQVGNNHSNNC